MQWKIQVESEDGKFADTGETWDDDTKPGIDWGEQSDIISRHLDGLKAADEKRRCYSAMAVK